MKISRAKEINNLLINVSLGFKESYSKIKIDFTLEEMLQAQKVLKRSNDRKEKNPSKSKKGTSRYMLIDPRGLAALYVANHYRGEDPEGDSFDPIVRSNGNVILVIKDKEVIYES